MKTALGVAGGQGPTVTICGVPTTGPVADPILRVKVTGVAVVNAPLLPRALVVEKKPFAFVVSL